MYVVLFIVRCGWFNGVGVGYVFAYGMSVGVCFEVPLAWLRVGGFTMFGFAVVVFVVWGAASFLDVFQKISAGDLTLLLRFSVFQDLRTLLGLVSRIHSLCLHGLQCLSRLVL
jgi:hypothetical protein